MMGFVGLTWYPDPVRVSHKGVVIPVAHDIPYILRALKKPFGWATMSLATFTGVECLVESMRDPNKESTYINAMAGGAACGALMGSMSKRFDIMASTALGMSLLMGMADFNGQRISIDPAAFEKTECMRLSLTEEESDTLKALKEKYPEFKHY